MAKETFKFKAHIHRAKMKKGKPTQYYSTLVARNGEIAYAGETRTRKSGVRKTIENLFPGVEVIDHTIEKK